MKNNIIVSISTVKGSKYFQISPKFKKNLQIGILLFILAIISTGAFIYYLLDHSEYQLNLHRTLEKESSNLLKDLESLKALKSSLQEELNNKESQLTDVSDRLSDIEYALGVKANDGISIEDRLDTASINSSLRIILLNNIPNGHPMMNDSRVTSSFGIRTHPVTKKRKQHRGIDFSAKIGTPIYATANGVVEILRKSKTGFGNYIRIQHGYGFTTSYAHLSKFAISRKSFVKKGELIGYSGNSGLSTGPHLHYEVRFVGTALNPRNFMEWNINNFDVIFNKEKGIKWLSLINQAKSQINQQLQLSSQKDVTLQAKSS